MVRSLTTFFQKLLLTGTGRNSLIMFVGSLLVGAVNYLFHPLIIRLMGPQKYGELASLLSIFTIISVSITALSTVVVKFTSTYNASQDYASVRTLINQLTKKLTFVGLIFFLGVSLLSPLVASFLKLSSPAPVVVLGVMIFLSFLFFTNLGILQGLLKFLAYSFSNLTVAILRIALPLFVVVVLKFSVTGVMLAISVALLAGYLISFWPLKFLFKEKQTKSFDWNPLLKFSFATFLTVLGSTLLISMDIILVKHFFSSTEAGIYAAGSTLGKIILFSTTPIAQVMFPLVSEKHASKKSYLHLLIYALVLVSLISGFTTLIYFLFPHFVVNLFSPKSPEIALYIGLFGIFISIYSLANVFVNFFLSIHKITVSYATLLAGLLLVIFLWLYHGSLYQVISVCILVNLLLLTYLIGYFLYNLKKESYKI